MKVSEVMSRVRSTSGDQTALQFTDSQLVDWINDGVRQCAVDNNLCQIRATQPTVVNQYAYDVPAGVLKIHSIRYDNAKLEGMTLEQFDEQYPGGHGSENGTPQLWYIWASKLNLYPAPDAIKQLTFDYIYAPIAHTVAGAGTEEIGLPVGYHSRIVDYCLAQVAQQDDNMTIYNVKMQEFKTGVQELKDQPESTYDLYPSMSVDSRDMGDASGWGDYY